MTTKKRTWRPVWTLRQNGAVEASATIRVHVNRTAAEWLASMTSMSLTNSVRWIIANADAHECLNASRVVAGTVLVVEDGIPRFQDRDFYDPDEYPGSEHYLGKVMDATWP